MNLQKHFYTIPPKGKKYSDCSRNYVKQLYDYHKNNDRWGQCGFFYSEEDYLSLKAEYPLVTYELCKLNSNSFKNLNFIRELDRLAKAEKKVFFSIAGYFGMLNKKTKKIWNESLG